MYKHEARELRDAGLLDKNDPFVAEVLATAQKLGELMQNPRVVSCGEDWDDNLFIGAIFDGMAYTPIDVVKEFDALVVECNSDDLEDGCDEEDYCEEYDEL